MRSKLTVVCQEPDESLSPRMTIGQNISEPLHIHEPSMTREALRARVVDTLEAVSLDPIIAIRYPTQLSVGQPQRVGAAGRASGATGTLVLVHNP